MNNSQLNMNASNVRGMSDEGLAEAIRSTKKLLWNASQMRKAGSVISLSRKLDALIDERRRREKGG